jgi:hypothetical protein
MSRVMNFIMELLLFVAVALWATSALPTRLRRCSPASVQHKTFNVQRVTKEFPKGDASRWYQRR